MRLLSTIFASSLATIVLSAPLSQRDGAAGLSLAEIDQLAPQFGFQSGVNPTGTGDCDGAVTGSDGKPVKVPCDCPPPRDLFIQDLADNIAAGHAVNNTGVSLSFPTDNSVNSQLARFNAAAVTLQNLRGPGVGCPIASTTWTAQTNAIRNGQTNVVSSPAAAPASSTAPALTSLSAALPSSSPAVTSASKESSSPVLECPGSHSQAANNIVATTPAAANPAATTAASDNSSDDGGVTGADGLTLAQIDALTPQFGFQSGVNPDGTGNCDGAVDDANGNPIKIPCSCPPPRDLFIQDMAQNIAAGHAVNNTVVSFTFPTDDSVASQLARFNAAAVTLQNLFGPGVGCPVASTTWTAQANAISDGTSSSPASAPSSASATSASSVTTPPPDTTVAPTSTASAATSTITGADGLTLAQIDALTPQLGGTAGLNPDGTGNCDGAVDDANGNPIKVPCSCPPARDVFIQSLAADIADGHAVNNPSVDISFPTGNSTADQITRIQAAIVALQNLNGPGQGCPAASTTLSAQLKALTG